MGADANGRVGAWFGERCEFGRYHAVSHIAACVLRPVVLSSMGTMTITLLNTICGTMRS